MSGLFNTKCDKCGKKSSVLETSVFDVNMMICPDCYEKERKEPGFDDAKIALRKYNEKIFNNEEHKR